MRPPEELVIEIYHCVPILGDQFACVQLRSRSDDVGIVIGTSDSLLSDHVCSLPLNADTKPSSRLTGMDLDKIGRLASRLLKLDGQAMVDYKAGRNIIKPVTMRNTRPVKVALNPSNLRELTLNAGQLVRPLLLPPPDLSNLRPFQVKGVNWLLKNNRGILADDMGLGKTVQAISAVRVLFQQGLVETALVICPKSLITNWEEELTKWAPELSWIRVVPTSSARASAWKQVFGKTHVILTNYEQIRTPPKELLDPGIDILIADEAHRIRNAGSKVAQGFRQLNLKRFWALTGTPLERDADDLATLLSMIEPSRFSSTDGSLHPASLRSQARPFMLRRLKSDVLPELPEVLETRQILDLLPKQKQSYQRTLERLALPSQDFLALINELRILCDYDPITDQSAKAERIIEILQNVRSAGEKAVVFSYLLRPLDILKQGISESEGKSAVVELRGDMSASDRDKALTEFKEDPNATALLCSSRVGGEGLTLTQANHVIFFNEWWNPSANIQARDRVVRIGQSRVVQVYKFQCRDTIEEDLENILETKSGLMEDLVDGLADGSSLPVQTSQLITSLAERLTTKAGTPSQHRRPKTSTIRK